MLKVRKLESEVVERPDDFDVTRPTGLHTSIEPFHFINQYDSQSGLVILNQPITDINLIQVWNNTSVHVCADGGANQLYNYFEDDNERAGFIPDYIVGDMDSLEKGVADYYSSRGSKVVLQSTQYSSDFMKAMTVIQIYFHSAESRKDLQTLDIDTKNGLSELLETYSLDVTKEPTVYVYILSGIGGRFDQTVHSISQLYSFNNTCPYLQLFFVTNSDVIFLLKKGKNYIHYPSKDSFHTKKVPVCGLLPLGTPSVLLSTLGLKYDVTNWESSIGGNVSSSNGVCGTTGVIVETTGDIVMNVEVIYSER